MHGGSTGMRLASPWDLVNTGTGTALNGEGGRRTMSPR